MTPHLRRAELLIDQHRFADAEKELGMALGQDPDDAWAHALLSLCLAEREKFNEASARARQAVSLAPDSAEIRRLAAHVALVRDDYPQAEQLFTEAIELDPYQPASFAGRAAVHAQRKHWQKTMEDVDRALELDPENVQAINLRSLANRGLGRAGQGMGDVQHALKVDPNDAHSHANLGWSYLEQHDLKQAEQHFREALRIDPSLDWARVGVLETTKAKFPVYRWVLSYFLKMARLTGQAQMAIIVGLWVVNRMVRSAAEAHPDWAPVLLPITWFYLLFCVMTWFIVPLGNATLMLHPFARMALNRKEKIEACIVGGLFVVVLGLLIASFFDPTHLTELLAVLIGFPGLPLAMSWKFDHPKPRRIMLAVTAGVALCALAFVTQISIAGGLLTKVPQPVENLVDLAATLFLLSPLVVLVLTNVLAVKNWRQD